MGGFRRTARKEPSRWMCTWIHAGLNVHKDIVRAAVRRPAADGASESRRCAQYRTSTAALRELRAWPAVEGVTQWRWRRPGRTGDPSGTC